ncbi:hypothetical protein ACOMHN_053886 [Nucella lapillus]
MADFSTCVRSERQGGAGVGVRSFDGANIVRLAFPWQAGAASPLCDLPAGDPTNRHSYPGFTLVPVYNY